MTVNTSQNSIIKIVLTKEEMGLTRNNFKSLLSPTNLPSGTQGYACSIYVPQQTCSNLRNKLRESGVYNYTPIAVTCQVIKAGGSQNMASYPMGILAFPPTRPDNYMDGMVLGCARNDSGTFLDAAEINWVFHFLAV